MGGSPAQRQRRRKRHSIKLPRLRRDRPKNKERTRKDTLETFQPLTPSSSTAQHRHMRHFAKANSQIRKNLATKKPHCKHSTEFTSSATFGNSWQVFLPTFFTQSFILTFLTAWRHSLEKEYSAGNSYK